MNAVSVCRIALLGAGGRMGRAVLEAAAAYPQARITAALVRPGSSLVGRRVGDTGDIKFTSDLPAALADCDVLLDFSTSDATEAALAACIAAQKPIVTGVTGFGSGLDEKIRAAGRSIPVLAAPNMSLGVALLMRLVESAAAGLGRSFDVEILETHHRHKKDAPSGTALALGKVIAAARGVEFKPAGPGVRGPRRPDEIGFASVRAGDIAGEHTVLFAGEGERLELTHRAASRATFAHGALRAAAWIVDRPPGVYALADVLGA